VERARGAVVRCVWRLGNEFAPKQFEIPKEVTRIRNILRKVEFIHSTLVTAVISYKIVSGQNGNI